MSRASAVGLWQFMEGTARGYGMWVGPLLDERRNPFKSTAAAADFLAHPQGASSAPGSWRWRRTTPARTAWSGSSTGTRPWRPVPTRCTGRVRQHLPAETRDFVPKFFAAVEVAGTRQPTASRAMPDSPGIRLRRGGGARCHHHGRRRAGRGDVPRPRSSASTRRSSGASRHRGGRPCCGCPQGEARPSWRTTRRSLRSERVTFVEHRVKRGRDALAHRPRYRVPVKDIEAANPGVRPRRLQIGQRITVPVAPSARRARSADRAPANGRESRGGRRSGTGPTTPSAVQVPARPPSLRRSRIPSMRIPRSTAFTMS